MNNCYIVIDTNVLLKTPYVLDEISSLCEKIFIPNTVLTELNYQKNHGTNMNKKQANLCLGKIIENKLIVKNKDIEECGRTNDQKIICFAEHLAINNKLKNVYLISNDKDFKIWCNDSSDNLIIIDTKNFYDKFNKENSFDVEMTRKFYDLVATGNIKEAKKMCHLNINVNYLNGNTGFTPLIHAVRNKDINMILFLLNINELKINEVDNNKFCIPALSHAIQIHDFNIVKILVDAGANVNAPAKNNCNYYNTPLMIASWNGDLQIVKYLLQNGACLNQADKKNGFTPLIKATINNHYDVVEILINSGADKSICSFEEMMAVDYASQYNKNGKYDKIIKLLKNN